MTSDNLAALEEIKRNGTAFAVSIESLFRSEDVDVEMLITANRAVYFAMQLAENAILKGEDK